MLAFALQTYGNSFGKGDVHAAVDLCHLLADIEPSSRTDCYFMVVFRKDTPVDLRNQCVTILREKFRADGFIARNYATSHPYGSNMLWLSTLTEAEGQYRDAQKNKMLPQFNGVLTFETDCIPLRGDWIKALTNEWNEKVIAAGEWTEEESDAESGHTLGWPKFEVLGHKDHDHINGNMILRPDIRTRYPKVVQFTTNLGWDYCNKELYLKIGYDTNLILQHYRRGTISREEIPLLTKNDVVPALFHGVQDKVGRDARKFMRELLVDGVTA